MEKEERESIEWINTWWSEANRDSKRGLLVGDSTTRQLRTSIESLLRNIYAVDLFASSFSIHDRHLEDYMNVLFKDDEYKYDFIVLNYGGHHGFSRLCSENLDEYIKYQEAYATLLKKIIGKCEKVVCVTGTSEVLDTDVNTIDQKIEREVIIRNQIVSDVARANCIEVFDLYGLMKKHRGIYTYVDRQHFGRDSDYFISCNLLEFMLSKQLISKELISRQHFKDRNRFMEIVKPDKKYMVYGAGVMATEFYLILKWYSLEDAISCFVVSQEINENRVLPKPIMIISELGAEERENSILVIASDKYKDEMYQMAMTLQIRHVIFCRDVINGLLQGE